MIPNRKEIMPDVYLTYLPADRFKTCLLSAHLITGLDASTASLNALLPAVLRRGTMRCPDMESLSAALDTLYGATIDYTLRKKGERQCIGFVANCIDDAYAPGGEKLLEPLAQLLGDLFLDPATKGGRFRKEYVDSEKKNLVDAIRAIRNDKRDWADVRLMQEMCAGEPYGVLRLGDEASAAKIDSGKLYAHYQQLLSSSRMEMFYSGTAPRQRVEAALRDAFSTLRRSDIRPLAPTTIVSAPAQVRHVTEAMDVTQGKLSMGWRCETEDIPAMVMANLLFGGTSNAKLFLNVREKMSLCYYASSSYVRSKRLMTVSSGIETADYDKAVAEILHQLEEVQNGNWESWELEGALATMVSGLRSLSDSQSALENFYLGQIAADETDTELEFMESLRQVTPERIRAAAKSAKLDTVYFLKGKEDASC